MSIDYVLYLSKAENFYVKLNKESFSVGKYHIARIIRYPGSNNDSNKHLQGFKIVLWETGQQFIKIAPFINHVYEKTEKNYLLPELSRI